MTIVTLRWLGFEPYAPAALTPQEIFLVLITVKRLSRPQGHSAAGRIMSMKNPVTATGIEPATFWLVVQCLNQLRDVHCAYLPLSLSF